MILRPAGTTVEEGSGDSRGPGALRSPAPFQAAGLCCAVHQCQAVSGLQGCELLQRSTGAAATEAVQGWEAGACSSALPGPPLRPAAPAHNPPSALDRPAVGGPLQIVCACKERGIRQSTCSHRACPAFRSAASTISCRGMHARALSRRWNERTLVEPKRWPRQVARAPGRALGPCCCQPTNPVHPWWPPWRWRAPLAAMSGSVILRLRGLPFSASPEDVEGFFEGYETADVYLGSKNGWAGGAGGTRSCGGRLPRRGGAPKPTW